MRGPQFHKRRMDWSSDLGRAILRQFVDGASARDLAMKFGVSRNAILGAAHRQGLKSGFRPAAQHFPKTKPRSRKRTRPPVSRGKGARRKWVRAHTGCRGSSWQARLSPASLPCQDLPEISDARPAKDGAGIGILEIGPRQCRWTLTGEGRDVRFCGAPVDVREDGQPCSWCAPHRKAARLKTGSWA